MLLLLKYFLLHVFPCDLQQDMTISRRIISSIKYGMLICNHFPVIVVFLKLPLSSTVNIWSSLMVDLQDKNMAERLRIKGLFFLLPYHVWLCQILSVDSHSICQGMRLEKINNKPRLCSWVHMGKNTLSNKKIKIKNPKHSCVIFHSTCKKSQSKWKWKTSPAGQKNVILFYRSFSSLLKIAQKLPKTIRCCSLVGFHDRSVLYRYRGWRYMGQTSKSQKKHRRWPAKVSISQLWTTASEVILLGAARRQL